MDDIEQVENVAFKLARGALILASPTDKRLEGEIPIGHDFPYPRSQRAADELVTSRICPLDVLALPGKEFVGVGWVSESKDDREFLIHPLPGGSREHSHG